MIQALSDTTARSPKQSQGSGSLAINADAYHFQLGQGLLFEMKDLSCFEVRLRHQLKHQQTKPFLFLDVMLSEVSGGHAIHAF